MDFFCNTEFILKSIQIFLQIWRVFHPNIEDLASIFLFSSMGDRVMTGNYWISNINYSISGVFIIS